MKLWTFSAYLGRKYHEIKFRCLISRTSWFLKGQEILWKKKKKGKPPWCPAASDREQSGESQMEGWGTTSSPQLQPATLPTVGEFPVFTVPAGYIFPWRQDSTVQTFHSLSLKFLIGKLGTEIPTSWAFQENYLWLQWLQSRMGRGMKSSSFVFCPS